ncbi:hypothetical protein QQ045_020762 [Rhodiola kirilowii]
MVPRVMTTSPNSSSPVVGIGNGGGGVNYIEHHVSKIDTLAGVAIKYGVEVDQMMRLRGVVFVKVADIKKMNSLVTDLQMFALKTLQILLPGRHPPSPCLSNSSESPGYVVVDCCEPATYFDNSAMLFLCLHALVNV